MWMVLDSFPTFFVLLSFQSNSFFGRLKVDFGFLAVESSFFLAHDLHLRLTELWPKMKDDRSCAEALHSEISADRWCVTSSDLTFLKKEVQAAIRRCDIRPHGRDDFEISDEIYGPSIYTVNEQYIKPVTSLAGMMSWALMRNPAGLDCHLFISHAWQEGIFEFLGKVIHSWPRGAQNAWCCMLANPQNLNIESFLQSPSHSPFALALRASDVVLVVPNRHKSVYTRLWCAYEAYLAHQEGKTILIAKTSNLHCIFVALGRMAVAAIIGAAVGSFAREHRWPYSQYVLWLASCAAVAAYNVQHNLSRMILNFFCVMCCFIKLNYWVPIYEWAVKWGFPWQIHFAAYLCFFLMAAVFFCLLEVDRVNAERTFLEAEQLRHAFKGGFGCKLSVELSPLLNKFENINV